VRVDIFSDELPELLLALQTADDQLAEDDDE
jgi:hypothetical protein